MPTEGPYILLYDRDCRFCAASARWAKALDLRGRLRVQPIQASRDLLPQLQEEQILDAMHVIDAEGRVSTGGDSLPPLVEALLAGPPLGELIWSSRGMRRALRRAGPGGNAGQVSLPTPKRSGWKDVEMISARCSSVCPTVVPWPAVFSRP